MQSLTFSGRNINEVIDQVQRYLDEQGIPAVTANVYLLPDELAERWRVKRTHLENLRVTGDGPVFFRLSNSSRAKVRYPLFGQGGVLSHERDRLQHSTTG